MLDKREEDCTREVLSDSDGAREVHMASLSPLIEEILASGGTAEITVTGNSMYPMLKHRKSQVRLAAPTKLQIGDIPLYRRENGAYILHRIVNTEGEVFTCCGDHQWHLEKGIRPEQVIAVVTDFKRGNRWISCENTLYRCYWRLWRTIRPLRRLVFGGIRRVKRWITTKR